MENDLKINDISVSRFHAMISVSNNASKDVRLHDGNSKFGTLVLLKSQLPLVAG